MKYKLIVAFFATLFVMATAAISWGITVGIIKLICMCFSLEFNLMIATGIWLAMFLIRSCFKSEGGTGGGER